MGVKRGDVSATSGDPQAAFTILDLRHLGCPMPVLRTRKMLRSMRPGTTVRVLCTDPLAGLDIPHLLQETGDILVSQETDGAVLRFEIRKRF
jgi:TusA-related sulfurtransferase